MRDKKKFMKKIIFGFFAFLSVLIIGEIIVLALDSRTPAFNQPVKSAIELIPYNSSKVILFTQLEKESKGFLNHSLVTRFKQLKMTSELVYGSDTKPFVKAIKAFEKYTGLNFDEQMLFRFFGGEGAISWINKDIFVIAKVDRLTLFLKQLAKTVSKYSTLQNDINTVNYKGISIEELKLGKQKLYFTFIGSYMFSSNSIDHIKSIIQLAKGQSYKSIAMRKGFKESILLSKKKVYPIVFYKKASQHRNKKELGAKRFQGLFTDHYWKIAFKNNSVALDYEYNFSRKNRTYSLSNIISSDKKKTGKILKGFPKATAFYIATEQLDSEKLYKWFLESWLRKGEQKIFNTTFNEVESYYGLGLRDLIKKEMGSDVAVIMTGIGYQGHNPFPKLAFISKMSKYSKPIKKMKKIFYYAMGQKKLAKTKTQGVTSYYFQSQSRFGYDYYYSNRKNTTSKSKDFSPSFAYLNGYLIVTFNKNTLKAIITYFKGAKGLCESDAHESFWRSIKKEYPFRYYINPDRVKKLATTYLDNLYNNQPDVFYHNDAKKRMIPLLELLKEIKGIGGGFQLDENKVQGELLIKLK